MPERKIVSFTSHLFIILGLVISLSGLMLTVWKCTDEKLTTIGNNLTLKVDRSDFQVYKNEVEDKFGKVVSSDRVDALCEDIKEIKASQKEIQSMMCEVIRGQRTAKKILEEKLN